MRDLKITKEIFEKSFFSIGGGFDIEPMIRFSHICPYFINVNLYLQCDAVTHWYDWAFERCDDIVVLAKEVIYNFDELQNFELHPRYISHLSNPDFISGNDLRGYLNTFSSAHNLMQYAVVYKLFRKSLNREIIYFHCTAEGLATYIALSQNGIYAPVALCTIQTGVLEHPDSILNAMFLNVKRKRPQIWIRGFEPSFHLKNSENNTLDQIGVFKNKVLDFNSVWSCGFSYRPVQRTDKRFVKGFVTDQQLEKLRAMRLKPEYQNERHQFLFEPLGENTNRIAPEDMYLFPSHVGIKHRLRLPKVSGGFEDWRSFTWPHDWNQTNIVQEQFRRLVIDLKLKNLNKDATLHIIPYCLEDEGKTYFEELVKLPYKTITYLPNLFDFIDLKQ